MIHHPFDDVQLFKPVPPPREPLPPVLQLEVAYQMVVVGCLIEMLLTVFLAPRGEIGVPVVYQSVAAIRGLVLLGLVLLVLPYKTRVVLPALLIWAAMLCAPELWAFALEARAGMPLTLIGTLLLALGIQASFRLHSKLGLVYLGLLLGSILLPTAWNAFFGMIQPSIPIWLIVSSLIFLVAYWKDA
jgi:hypothetical protein